MRLLPQDGTRTCTHCSRGPESTARERLKSRALKQVEILRSEGIEFSTFDILEDNEVREGLKTFSNWPTYPQLYAKGQLVGGLDIIKELQEGGELKGELGIEDEAAREID